MECRDVVVCACLVQRLKAHAAGSECVLDIVMYADALNKYIAFYLRPASLPERPEAMRSLASLCPPR